MKPLFFLVLFLVVPRVKGELLIAENGEARCVIHIDAGASAPERTAANELVATLNRMTGATFVLSTNAQPPDQAILVGTGQASRRTFPEIRFDDLGAEELLMQTRGTHLLLAGGHPRGTLYAVSRFLQEQCGVRWWTPWAAQIPRRSTLKIGALEVRKRPAFEYRESFWYTAFDGDWSWRNGCNGHASRLTPEATPGIAVSSSERMAFGGPGCSGKTLDENHTNKRRWADSGKVGGAI